MKKYTSRSGITAISQPRSFALPDPHHSYRPDFYVVEDNCFYEVLGSRQASSQQREKIDAFRLAYPHLTLKITNEGAWTTDWNPEVDSRHSKFEPALVVVKTDPDLDDETREHLSRAGRRGAAVRWAGHQKGQQL